MISKRSVRAFLSAKRKDFRNYQKLSPGRIEQLMEKLPIRPPMWDHLRPRQKVMALIGARTKRFAFFADTGIGKTVTSVALARYFRRTGDIKRMLVLVPNRINKEEWGREITKHSPKTSYLLLDGSSEQKWQQLQSSKSLIVVETYMGLIRMVSDLVDHKKKRGKQKLAFNIAAVKLLKQQFQGLVMDESHSAKTRNKLPFRICRALSKQAEVVFALTGTPFGRDPTDLWGQMFLVDFGETLGPTLGLFRAAFFKESSNYWGGFDYKFIHKKEPELHRLLANRSIRYSIDGEDMPNKIPVRKVVSLPADAEIYVQRAKEVMQQFRRGNLLEVKNAFLRMRQLSSGFIGFKDDETGERAQVVLEQNPKLEMLMALVSSIEQKYKSVVFCDFHYSISRVSRELKEAKIGHVTISGKTKTRDLASTLRRFDHDDKVRVLILSGSMVAGLNLQTARFGFFYESPVSPILRKQAERRIERQFSKHETVMIYDLITEGTYDERILHYHRVGGDLFAAIVEGKDAESNSGLARKKVRKIARR